MRREMLYLTLVSHVSSQQLPTLRTTPGDSLLARAAACLALVNAMLHQSLQADAQVVPYEQSQQEIED